MGVLRGWRLEFVANDDGPSTELMIYRALKIGGSWHPRECEIAIWAQNRGYCDLDVHLKYQKQQDHDSLTSPACPSDGMVRFREQRLYMSGALDFSASQAACQRLSRAPRTHTVHALGSECGR
jgi:hypothetical protein